MQATIRREMQGDVFGSSKGVWKNEALLDGEVFPLHSRGMVKGKMEAPLARFVAAIEERVDVLGDEVDDAAGGELELSLVDWVKTTVHGASIPTLFGPSFASHANLSPPQLQATLEAFDAAFPLLASGLVPAFLHPLIPPIAKGLRARDELSKAIATWILDDLPGLEEGVVRDMTAACLDAGHPASEAAKLVIGNIWALTANSPSAAVWMLLYVLQSGDLLDDILAEIDLAKQQPPTLAHLSSSMPLVASCLTETLRTSTSTLSIRTVERDFFLSTLPTSSPDADTKGPGSTTQGYLLPAGSRVIAATRMAHVSKKVWGEDAAEWDGRRFWDREGEEAGVRSRKARLVHGYGGGVSMVRLISFDCCAGRVLMLGRCSAKVDISRRWSSRRSCSRCSRRSRSRCCTLFRALGSSRMSLGSCGSQGRRMGWDRSCSRDEVSFAAKLVQIRLLIGFACSGHGRVPVG